MEFTKEELGKIYFALEMVRWVEEVVEEDKTRKVKKQEDPLIKRIEQHIDYSREYSDEVFDSIGEMLEEYSWIEFWENLAEGIAEHLEPQEYIRLGIKREDLSQGERVTLFWRIEDEVKGKIYSMDAYEIWKRLTGAFELQLSEKSEEKGE